MGTRPHTDVLELPAYRRFYRLALDVEQLTREFQADFQWLRDRALRASEAICAAMTAGFYAPYSTEYRQSLYQCRRQGREVCTHLAYARDVGQLPDTTCEDLVARYQDALGQLSKLITALSQKIGAYAAGTQALKEDGNEYGAGAADLPAHMAVAPPPPANSP